MTSRPQHLRPWGDTRTTYVPLWTDDVDGEWREGKIVVPARLAHSQPDTNERHEFDKLIGDSIRSWAEWRERTGWIMNSRPKVRGPYDPPFNSTKGAEWEDKGPEEYWYFITARFKRASPLFVKFSDFDAIQVATERLEPDRDSGWVDPMKFAEERRLRQGLKRKDYLAGPLENPVWDLGRNPGDVTPL